MKWSNSSSAVHVECCNKGPKQKTSSLRATHTGGSNRLLCGLALLLLGVLQPVAVLGVFNKNSKFGETIRSAGGHDYLKEDISLRRPSLETVATGYYTPPTTPRRNVNRDKASQHFEDARLETMRREDNLKMRREDLRFIRATTKRETEADSEKSHRRSQVTLGLLAKPHETVADAKVRIAQSIQCHVAKAKAGKRGARNINVANSRRTTSKVLRDSRARRANRPTEKGIGVSKGSRLAKKANRPTSQHEEYDGFNLDDTSDAESQPGSETASHGLKRCLSKPNLGPTPPKKARPTATDSSGSKKKAAKPCRPGTGSRRRAQKTIDSSKIVLGEKIQAPKARNRKSRGKVADHRRLSELHRRFQEQTAYMERH